MPESLKVLLAGSSSMTHSDEQAGPAIPDMVSRLLREAAPEINWQIERALLFPGRTMQARAAALLDEHQPDAFVLWLTSVPFGDDAVVFAIRDRWPRAYPLAMGAAEMGRKLTKSGKGQKPSRAFEVPRALLAATIGAAPETPLERATEHTLATLAELARRESMAVVCRLAVPIERLFTKKPEHERRVRLYRESVIEACKKWRFSYFDSHELADQRGRTLTYTVDGLYHDAASRAFEAELVAEQVLSQTGVVVDSAR